ncbi:histidine phosphatase family protein [Streptomyces albipurpureus]|uniref:Histidine phosphatase family protein n=1 Tax=Streptomyces albipurpureus TaxID=2897419 RepID=A0ABT0UG14_9ACTN|nr:histidine phosphatase family protein [Streptomyces sp. CWNU-1]MCM2387005.1 histidine phosphatase family protein [Streptomyces sp. CWNU-1]
MTVRVMLISPAMTAALREARFGGECPLDEHGVRAASAAARSVPRSDLLVRGPSLRCRQTAEALGLRAEASEQLTDWDVGRWTGLTLDQVSAQEPAAVDHWLRDPTASPHGGESLRELCARAGEWLESLPDGRTLAVVEPALVRALTVGALGLAPEVFWRLDVGPLTLTELKGRRGRWNLVCGGTLGGGPVPGA